MRYMSDEVDRVLSEVASTLDPDPAERQALDEAVDGIIDRTEAAIEELGLNAEVIHVGSTARDTWLSGERDIDIFVQFPTDTDRDTLRSRGLDIGRAVLVDGEANYAEHPYITGSFDGFDVDVVPCFDVTDATQARSSVDRTPFHNAYVAGRLDDRLASEVRLAKHFTGAIGIYGSNLRTRGFGGYLLELLVLEFGRFRDLLEAVADWRPPVEIDPEEHATTTFEDDLVVIDPTDPDRNVAAVVTRTNLARFQHHARGFLAQPRDDAFAHDTPSSLSSDELADELSARETTLLAVVFERPRMVDDQLFPQLRKTHDGIVDALDRLGFGVLRSAEMASQAQIAVVIEVETGSLAKIERHEGPPIYLRDHAQRFYETYAETEVYGPYIEEGRYVIERQRRFTTPRAFLESEAIFDVKIGEHLEEVLEERYTVYVDEELADLLDDFGVELAAYFDPQP